MHLGRHDDRHHGTTVDDLGHVGDRASCDVTHPACRWGGMGRAVCGDLRHAWVAGLTAHRGASAAPSGRRHVLADRFGRAADGAHAAPGSSRCGLVLSGMRSCMGYEA